MHESDASAHPITADRHRFAIGGVGGATAVIDYVQGVDTPAEAWPYLLPGPGDAWAGRKAYRARWTVTLDAAPQRDVDLALWFVDTTRLGGRLDVAVNGRSVRSVELAKGATRGSREGHSAGTRAGSAVGVASGSRSTAVLPAMVMARL